MSTGRILEVKIEDRTSSHFAGRHILIINYCDNDDNLQQFNSFLNDGDTEEELIGNRLDSTNSKVACTVIRSLMKICGDGKELQLSQRKISNFLRYWNMEAFKFELDNYLLNKKLTHEQAIQVINEYYIIEPIMQS